ncbi:MAG: SufE family protein, partial [Anaerolineales bacterium]|nr:SufE family protein [Anaerolineales bacterium]
MDMMTPEELLQDFAVLETWDDRYGYLIDLGRALPPMAE